MTAPSDHRGGGGARGDRVEHLDAVLQRLFVLELDLRRLRRDAMDGAVADRVREIEQAVEDLIIDVRAVARCTRAR